MARCLRFVAQIDNLRSDCALPTHRGCSTAPRHPPMDYTLLIGQLSWHLASILTMVGYLLRDILWLRFLTILSCFAGIVFNYVVPATPFWTVIWWNVLFAIINVVQIAII